jgi:7-cyano-7-deazaguanine synthase in queuosine biosynthesis
MSRLRDAEDSAVRRWAFNAGSEPSHGQVGVVVGELAIAERVGRALPAAAMDLIEIVAAVHLADRAERRPSASKSGDSWSRRVHLLMGVRDLPRWSDTTIHQELVGLLRWLTDDEWTIDFTRRDAPERSAETVRFLFQSPPGGDAVALFSGGLDSLAGLASDLDRGLSPLVVSVKTNSRLARSQKDVLGSLNGALGSSISRVPVELHLHKGRARESSQRARGFGFLALASVVAAVSGLDRVHVYENGVGSVNLPYTAAQVGAHGTRAMHPETLSRAASLFSQVLGHQISMVNPSQFLTKAELCSALPESLHATVVQAESCDNAFAHRRRSSHSCGCCTSCLLRRQSLAAAGLSGLDSSDSYRVDAFTADPCGLDLYELRAMLSQAARLRDGLAAVPGNPWRGVVREFPDLMLVASSLAATHVSAEPRLTGKLQRYVGEWNSVPSPLVLSYIPTHLPAA